MVDAATTQLKKVGSGVRSIYEFLGYPDTEGFDYTRPKGKGGPEFFNLMIGKQACFV